jgi:hypothetical protein
MWEHSLSRVERRETDNTARILIVEDEALNALYIASALEACGHAVFGIAATAEEALSLAADEAPDLVVMDITLRGEIDGVAAARALKERLDIPIVYVTAHSDRPTMQRAQSTDPAGYLLKPFTARQLQLTIEEALSQKARR